MLGDLDLVMHNLNYHGRQVEIQESLLSIGESGQQVDGRSFAKMWKVG